MIKNKILTAQKKLSKVFLISVCLMFWTGTGNNNALAQDNVELKVNPTHILDVSTANQVSPQSKSIINVVDENLSKKALTNIVGNNPHGAPLSSAGGKTVQDAELNSEKVLEINKSKKISSLFFTYWQHQSIMDAMQSRGDGGIIDGSEDTLTVDEKNETSEEIPVKPENRDISLSGIVYVKENDWTIWLNGMRVTPDAIPPEFIDLKVFKTHIDMKWYDEYTNKIFPIRIRPHQRFNLDTRVFLPG